MHSSDLTDVGPEGSDAYTKAPSLQHRCKVWWPRSIYIIKDSDNPRFKCRRGEKDSACSDKDTILHY